LRFHDLGSARLGRAPGTDPAAGVLGARGGPSADRPGGGATHQGGPRRTHGTDRTLLRRAGSRRQPTGGRGGAGVPAAASFPRHRVSTPPPGEPPPNAGRAPPSNLLPRTPIAERNLAPPPPLPNATKGSGESIHYVAYVTFAVGAVAYDG